MLKKINITLPVIFANINIYITVSKENLFQMNRQSATLNRLFGFKVILETVFKSLFKKKRFEKNKPKKIITYHLWCRSNLLLQIYPVFDPIKTWLWNSRINSSILITVSVIQNSPSAWLSNQFDRLTAYKPNHQNNPPFPDNYQRFLQANFSAQQIPCFSPPKLFSYTIPASSKLVQ